MDTYIKGVVTGSGDPLDLAADVRGDHNAVVGQQIVLVDVTVNEAAGDKIANLKNAAERERWGGEGEK